MSVFENGRFYHYEFKVDGRRHRGSTGTTSKPQAIAEERRQRVRLEKSYSQIIEQESREQQRKTIQEAADEFLVDYKAKHESTTFAVYALRHVTEHLGGKLVVEIDRERRGFVFRFVIDKEFICCFLDSFPLLFAGFLFDDLAVAFFQTHALATFLRDCLRFAGRAG